MRDFAGGRSAPKTQADFLREALARGHEAEAFFAVLDDLEARNQS